MKVSGFYSVVQFGPEPFRGECVNIGVVVGADGVGVEVIMAERNEHVKDVFGATSYDDARLSLAKRGLAARLKESVVSGEDLVAFIAKESGQQLSLLPPCPVVVRDLASDARALFLDMVNDPARRHRQGGPRARAPNLRRYFEPLMSIRPIEENVNVTIPVLGEELQADFAYTNGKRHLIKSYGFRHDHSDALDAASDMGSKGLLLASETAAGAPAMGLVVVSAVDDKDLRARIREVLRVHATRFVDMTEIREFVAEVERDAH